MPSNQNHVESDYGIKCPYCGFEDTEAESYGVHCTYWGSDGSRKLHECSSCCLEFEVSESVSRTWCSHPVVQEKAKANNGGAAE